MGDYKIKREDLGNIKLKTLLIYPPQKFFLYAIAPLGIPQLKSFLNGRKYKNLKVIDLRIITARLKTKIALTNYFYKKLLNSKIFKRYKNKKNINRYYHDILFSLSLFQNDKNELPFNCSLNSIVNSAIEYQFDKDKLYRYIKSLIEKEEIHLIGFSVTYPEQIFYSITLARMLKSFNKKIFIVMGGAQVSKNIKNFIKRKSLSKFIDGFIIGDGEEPLAELIYQLEHFKDFKKVPNFFYKNGCGKYTVSDCTFSCDSNYLITPDFDEFYCFILPLRASVGCFWEKCSFCTYRLAHKNYSCGNVKQIISIIKDLQYKYRVNYFRFVDDMLAPTFLKKFSQALLREDIKISWSCSIAFIQGFNKSLIKNMAEAGCQSISTGLESMSPRILRLMNKPHNLQLIKKLLGLFKDVGIKINGYFIFGFPTETYEEALTTLNFIQENIEIFEYILIQPFCLEEDTIIFNKPHKFGITHIYTKDKFYATRLGYRYDVKTGMNQEESKLFTEKAIKIIKSLKQ